MKSVSKHFDGDVDVGHFLVMGNVGVSTILANYLLGEEVAVIDVKVIEGLEGFEVGELATVAIQGVFDDGCKVFGGFEGLVGFEQVAYKGLNVKPICPLPTLGAKTVVEVIAVDVGNEALHNVSR